jgi:hypothetical protein
VTGDLEHFFQFFGKALKLLAVTGVKPALLGSIEEVFLLGCQNPVKQPFELAPLHLLFGVAGRVGYTTGGLVQRLAAENFPASYLAVTSADGLVADLPAFAALLAI